jgi:hypothetical protein
MSGERRLPFDLALLLLAYLSLALAYQRTVPLFEAPDEPSHVHYVALVALEHRLPADRGTPDVPGEGMQPPFYYVALAPLFSALVSADAALPGELRRASLVAYRLGAAPEVPADARIKPIFLRHKTRRFAVDPQLEPLRRLRWGSLGFGLLGVALTWTAIRRAAESRPLAFLGASLLAFDPQVLFVSSYVNNDAASLAIGAAAFWRFAVALQRPAPTRGDYAWLGLLTALGAATKDSTLPMLGATGLALLAVDRRPLRQRIVGALTGAGVAAAALSPLLASNLARFGDLLGSGAVWASAAGQRGPADFGGLSAYFTDLYPYATFESYWAWFGWQNVSAPKPVYLSFFALTFTGLLGFAIGAVRPRVAAPRQRALFACLALTSAATLGMHVWLNTRVVAAQGRHLFAAAPQIACILASGIAQTASGHPLGPTWRVALAVSGGMAALALYCVAFVIAPAYI